MSEPDWMPVYEAHFFKAHGVGQPIERLILKSDRQVEALEEMRVEMARQWIPGPRKGKRCRPSSASLMKVVRGQLEEVARLRWMVAEVVEIDLKMDQPFAKS